ncbi:hypothetical protein GCM10007424_25180 [Flavobacterium suaedae]|uniref:Antitoxin SocA-like Panacea domain-containing protein n=1 Tax=Flavobacterium suaedae TaxID=1767027 RepID=A0ABQ1K3V6_9FLAO|nr:type II toxin-antitoxin system antitoxin SocA domain-containing protein [Flavobacterium suaedae]GGB84129.1 hypothetical protein GCM10007424_25180 [Flavobacterium suaedae]
MQSPMYNPVTIANYFIKKHQEDEKLTPMKLIKLTYIAYGWYLAISKGDALVSEEPEAWDLGPVMPTLYHTLKKYGGNKVIEPISYTRANADMITDIDAKFLDMIWDKYGDYSGIELSAITHTKGSPWEDTYPKGHNLKIPKDLIQKHYEAKMNEEVLDNAS